jgi:hypothetical protein
MDLHYLDLYWVHTRKGQNIGLVVVGGSKPWLNYIYIYINRAGWNRQGFGAPMSYTRLTVVVLLSRPSYLPSPPTNGRTDAGTDGRRDGRAPTRRKRAFDRRRRKGVWRRRQKKKKGFVTVADIDAAVRLSAAINARCVRPCVYVCVFCAGQQQSFRGCGALCGLRLRRRSSLLSSSDLLLS